MKLSGNKIAKTIGGFCGTLLGAVALVLSFPAGAAAQCIMCYMTATAAGERGSHVLRNGIIVLIIPTMLTFAGIFLLAYRRRKPAEWPEDTSTEALDHEFPPANDPSAGFHPLPADQQGQPSTF